MREIYETADALDPEITKEIEKGFNIREVSEEEGIFIVEPLYDHATSFDKVFKELNKFELYPLYRYENGLLSLRIVRKKGEKRGIDPLFHAGLLIATVFTVTIAGYIWWAGGNIIGSFLFAIGLMGILGGHELGHSIVARKNRVDSTLPFFIPIPPFFVFGTLGAVIFMNSPIPDRKSLFDIGIAGPVVGFILSLPILIVGILLSSYVPFDPSNIGPFLLETPLLFNILSRLLLGSSGHGFVLEAHPLAIAGWAGLFVTALNLLPMGQLDGGHIVRSVLPKRYRTVYKLVYKILFIVGLTGFAAQMMGMDSLLHFFWPGWLIWAVLVYFMTRLEHPGPLNDVSPLDRRRKLITVFILLMFILSFIPVPAVPL